MMSSEDRKHSLAIGVVAFLVSGVLYGCATTGRQSAHDGPNLIPTMGTRGAQCCAMAKAVPRQKALAKTAVRFVGKSRVVIDGRYYNPDCSGFVRGVYASQRMDLFGGLGELNEGNGVGRIYTHVVEHGKIHYGPTVHPGDLVFFHNTWDFNRDGLPNDPLTHVGVVEKVEPDGTVLFVSSLSRGIKRYRMNLQHPEVYKALDGRVLNNFLRRKQSGDVPGTRYLAGQLFAAFGTLTR
ncbi:MAG: CHAP domain-containing protein [Nitrospira sp.]|jgi:probable lipoprotein NlpC|nr:CHAP domain-containing protein [Nitrospira sp.]MDH4243831.1 CHAP domain-containing protein [Nitrospira sp.]MDH4354907.1 CHAP domain-containing protein [Nitrospira sp.]MDH5317282.1 CHAP domain-containing protein [Nitrospira sp.]